VNSRRGSPARDVHVLLGACLAAALGLLASAARPAAADAQRLAEETVALFAAPFLEHQQYDGGYDVQPRVQTHLKAEIAMALVAEATHRPHYAESALRDHGYVIARHLEPDGGLNWDNPHAYHFFECHQHWFLIASHLIDDQLGTQPGAPEARLRVWRYLQQTNPSRQDFYLHNKTNHQAYFAYRCVDRDGRFMTQFPFKGSYEIGVALWSLTLLETSGQIDPSWGGGRSAADRGVPGTIPGPGHPFP
jgi:hypothetical protein